METESQITQIKTVKIFKTNVQNDKDSAKIATALLTQYPLYKINFDLEDCDKILRVEADQCGIETDNIIMYMVGFGYRCQEIK